MDKIKKNKKIALRWLNDLWNDANYGVANEFMAANYKRHDPFNPVDSPDEYANNIIEVFRKAFPDMKFTAEDLVAEKDKVLIRWSAVATHTGPLKNLPPTGLRAKLEGMDLLKIEGDKIVESWPGFDGLSLLKLMKIIPY